MIIIQVVVHYPKTEAAQKVLSRNIAEIHAEFIITRLKELQLSEKDTNKLISMICDRVNQSASYITKNKDGA